MSIENSAIHYIKDTMFGDFYLNNPLENKPLGRIFCQMVEFKSLENITYLSPTSVFMQDMLKAFEEFDNLEPKGLITQQFTALAQKCADKGVKLLIGENPKCGGIIGVDSNNLHQDHIFINFSEDMVKKQMNRPICVMQKSESGERYEIKTIVLKELIGKGETDESNIQAKCAAFLLFHELFHVNSFLDCQCDANIYNAFNNNYENLNLPPDEIFCLKKIFYDQAYVDDAINTLNISVNNQNRIPGEFELLSSIQSDKQIMRIYTGQENWNTDIEKMTYCSKIFNRIFNIKKDNKIHNLLIKINEVLDFKNRIIDTNLLMKTKGPELVMVDAIYLSVSQIEPKMNAIEVQHLYKFVILFNTINNQYTKPILLDLRDLEYTYKELKKTINNLNFSQNLRTRIHTFLNQENCFVLFQKIEILQQEFNSLQKSETSVSHKDKSIINRIELLLNVANQYIYNEIKKLPYV